MEWFFEFSNKVFKFPPNLDEIFLLKIKKINDGQKSNHNFDGFFLSCRNSKFPILRKCPPKFSIKFSLLKGFILTKHHKIIF
jgi:hypothetical protein